MKTTLRVIRDGAHLVGIFDNPPAGLEAFGHRARDGKKVWVYVRGEKGDRMPLLVACDWCRDQGCEVAAPAWLR